MKTEIYYIREVEHVAEASDKRAIIRQNLLDAGCDMGMIEKCMELVEKRDESVLLHMLERYKDELLETVHKQQERIDCLDYLVYRIRKGEYYG